MHNRSSSPLCFMGALYTTMFMGGTIGLLTILPDYSQINWPFAIVSWVISVPLWVYCAPRGGPFTLMPLDKGEKI